MARLNHGRAAACPCDAATFKAVLKVFNASSDGVVASERRIECSLMVASDSPALFLNLLAIRVRALSASSFFAACSCCSSNTSPLRQFLAISDKTY